MNSPVEFWHITIGNILTVCGGFVTLGALWWKFAQQATRMEDHVKNLTERMNKSETELDQMTKMGLMTTLAQHERRLQEHDRILDDFGEMRADIRWIKERLNAR